MATVHSLLFILLLPTQVFKIIIIAPLISFINCFLASCGDLTCDEDIGETCNNCFVDCTGCSYYFFLIFINKMLLIIVAGHPPCPSNCNGRGTCNLGICECSGNWAGPSCNNEGINHYYFYSFLIILLILIL